MNELGPHDTPAEDVAQVSFSQRRNLGLCLGPGLRPVCAPISTAVEEARALECCSCFCSYKETEEYRGLTVLCGKTAQGWNDPTPPFTIHRACPGSGRSWVGSGPAGLLAWMPCSPGEGNGRSQSLLTAHLHSQGGGEAPDHSLPTDRR